MSCLPTVRAKQRKNPLLPVDSLAFTVRRAAALPAAHPAEAMALPGAGEAVSPRTSRKGGGFTSEGTPRGGGFSKDTPRGGGFTGEGTPRGGGFGGTFSKTSQKTEISQSGTAGTGTPPTAGKSGMGTPGPQFGTAGKPPRSTQRPPVSEPQHSRDVPPLPATPTSGAQSSSPVQQEQRRACKKDKPPVKGGGSVPRPGMAGTAPGSRTPPGQKLGGGPSKQKPTRQTKREGGPADV